MTNQMIEVKTADLEGVALDWAVAKACDADIYRRTGGMISDGEFVLMIGDHSGGWSPSTNWSQGGPLIAAHRVSVIYSDEFCNPCAWTDSTAPWHGETPLIAACRAVVASKLGDSVSVPEVLV